MIAIVDYGMGNLRSVQKALESLGSEAVVTDDHTVLDAAQGIILPGVGAFGDAVKNLRARRLIDPTLRQVEREKPLLGICLGMQLLFDESEEMGQHKGLCLLPGRAVRFPQGRLKVPHVGWNQLHNVSGAPLEGITPGAYAYFVLATTEYGIEFASVVGRGLIWGAQFHPEKSQEVGLQLLKNFTRLVRERSQL
jgi:glutamine amidotransferase